VTSARLDRALAGDRLFCPLCTLLQHPAKRPLSMFPSVSADCAFNNLFGFGRCNILA
jgi:hypothetical protein